VILKLVNGALRPTLPMSLFAEQEQKEVAQLVEFLAEMLLKQY
jgi:hypothetical protein